jgi:hypothetical protein
MVVAAELTVAALAWSGAVPIDSTSTSHTGTRASTLVAYPATASVTGQLLSASDLGVGWSSVPDAVTAESNSCFTPRTDLAATNPATSATASWSTEYGVPTASETLLTYASPAQAAATFGSVASTLSACGAFPTGTGTNRTTAAVTSASLPVVGQESSAFLVTVQVGQSVGQADYLLAADGPHVVLLVYADGGLVDQAQVANVAEAAVARLGR